MWVARDRDGYLCAYGSKPHRGSNEWSSIDKYRVDDTVSIEMGTIAIDGRLFPELKWDDEPIEVDYLLSKEQIDEIVTEALRQTGIPQEKQAEILAHLIIHNYFLDYE